MLYKHILSPALCLNCISVDPKTENQCCPPWNCRKNYNNVPTLDLVVCPLRELSFTTAIIQAERAVRSTPNAPERIFSNSKMKFVLQISKLDSKFFFSIFSNFATL